jgi:phage shock protein A
VNKEVDEGEREAATERAKLPPEVLKARRAASQPSRRTPDDIRTELDALAATVARLEGERGALDARLAEPAGDAELQRLCDKLAEVADALDAAEEKWARLHAELDAAQ